MDILVTQILSCSVPVRESVKESEFKGTVKTIQDKIVEIFTYTSLTYVPQFLSAILKEIDEYVKSSDKRKKFASAICLTALIHLFPFDDYIPQYQPILDKLLRPGYKPLIKIAVMVLEQLTKIRGHNRDLFLRKLIEENRKKLTQTDSPDSRYAAAVIWEELSDSAPEHIYALGPEFTKTITHSLSLGDKDICDILIHTIENIIESESAPVGAELITSLPIVLVEVIKEHFVESVNKDDILANLRLLYFILDVKPHIRFEVLKDFLLPFCINLLKSPAVEVVEMAISVLCKMKTVIGISLDSRIIDRIINMLFKQAKKNPTGSMKQMTEIINAFPEFFMGQIRSFVSRVDSIIDEIDMSTGPLFAFNITIALISAIPADINIEPILDNVTKIVDKSDVPLPIHKIVVSLNESHPTWSHEFAFFKYQILQVVREELTNKSNRTDRIMYSLMCLNQIDNISFNDALEFNSLIVKFKKNKDIEVREMVAQSLIKCFKDYPESIPLNTIKKLVKFAISDPARSVRSKSLKAFTPSTYKYLAQPDIFSIFSNFIYDENTGIRKQALEIIRNLPVFEKSVLRNALLSSIKQTNINFGLIVTDIETAWAIFPDLIYACGKMLGIYAEGLFNKFISMLNTRFSDTVEKERSLMYMNSAILRTIDESLIQSLSRLHIMCPDIAPVQPIIEIYSKILTLTVHPWTKTVSLESLKDIIAAGTAQGQIDPNLMTALMEIISNNTNLKLVTKALKVVGAIGQPEIKLPTPKTQMILKTGMTNRTKFNKFFINHYFKYLVDLFVHNNLETTREAIGRCISCLFLYAPDEVPQFIPQFMDIFLQFIKGSKSPRLPVFYHYLTVMIESSGHLISPYTDKIFQSVEDNWHDLFTRECCIVLSSLVIATDGRCDSILHLVVSVSFLFVKTKKNAEQFANDIFSLIRVIAQYSQNFLSPIVSGVIDILNNPSNPSFLQEQSLDTLEFILRYCTSYSHLAAIERCLVMITQRSQVRWHDRARAILTLKDNIDFSLPAEKFNFKQPMPTPVFQKFDAQIFIDAMCPPRHPSGLVVQQNLSQWFINLREFFLKQTPNILIRTMQFLPSLPNFAFKFAFLSVWIQANESEKKHMSNVLSDIFEIPVLPDVVLSQFISLVEFANLCEIDLHIDTDLLIKKCINAKYFAKALFFLETMLQFRADLKSDESSDDEISFEKKPPRKLLPSISVADLNPSRNPKVIEQLIILNKATNRLIEAKAIAEIHKSAIKHSVWMKLGEWENAIEQIVDMPISKDNFSDRVLSYAGLDNWESIHKMKDEFEQQDPIVQSSLARFFWIAELYCGTKEEALRISNKTGGYTVNDCIQKIILLIQCGKLEEAHEIFHLSWRYLSSSVSTIERHNKTLIQEYTFQAAQLHELGDVISVLKGDETEDKIKKNWKQRLMYLKEYPRYQVDIYKIRSLIITDSSELEDLAFHILSCNMKAGHKSDMNRLIDIFFPNKESAEFKYAHLIKHGEKSIEKYQELTQEFPNISENLHKRLSNKIGKIMLKTATSADEINESLNLLQIAGNENTKIADVLTLLSYITREEDYAIRCLDAHLTVMQKKIKRSLLHTNQMFGLLVTFGKSDNFKEKLSKIIQSDIPRTTFIHMLSTLFGLLDSSEPNIVAIATQVVTIMIKELPQVILFDLLTMIKLHEDNDLFEDLQEMMQHEHPIYYAQMELVAQKLNKISCTIYDTWIDKLTEAFNSTKAGDYDKTNQILRKLLQSLSQYSQSKYEEQFKLTFNHKEQLQMLVKKKVYDGRDLASIDGIMKSIIARQDSIRVIPLASLDEQLEKKTTWSLSMLGKYKKPNLKITKFFHSVQRWKNGFKISIIGNDGKKYNYHLKRRQGYKNEPAEHFMALIDSITPIINVDQRSLIQISQDVTLHELLKGYLSLFDLISLYKQNNGQNAELEILNVSRKLEFMTHEQRVRKITHLTEGEAHYALAKAIFVTSKNAMAWLQRTSMFAQSIGALSALSFIFGDVNASPSDILFEKTTGATTFTAFSCTGKTNIVPFRLTPMMITAFGSCGVEGPFKLALTQYLDSIRGHRRGLAHVLQFVLEKPPFKDPVIPTQYISSFMEGKEDKYKHTNDVDLLYGRIAGDGRPVEEEIDELIEKAQSIDLLAQMPGSWVAWW